jgi:glyoxylase-like metal-dependent hydrolase (beta-lactamase superfamily II)
MTKTFASRGDMADKAETFTQLADGARCLTAEGDPNSGVVVGDDSVMVIDARATPRMARALVRRIRTVTDKPVRWLVLSHYHAVRVLGAAGYGRPTVIASRGTWEMIRERGAQDWKSEYERFPRLFKGGEEIKGLTWPDVVFDRDLTVHLGSRAAQVMHLGSGHTKGDTVVWLPKERVLFSGDLVEEGATPYCGDAQLAEWPATLDRLAALKPRALVPGRGRALTTPAACQRAIATTKAFVTELLAAARDGVARRQDLRAVYAATYAALKKKYGHWVIFEHCMPFDVARAFDEASGIAHPRIWTAKRDIAMWKALQG